MMFKTSINFSPKNSEFYYNLLKEEDFDFRNKNIKLEIFKNDKENNLTIDIETNSIIDFKIASSALVRSLEIIEKTTEV